MTEENITIDILKDSTNYDMWKFQITIFFKAKQVYDIVAGKRPCPTEEAQRIDWEKKDAIAQKLIITTVEKSVLTHLLNSTTSKEMYDKLVSIYERDTEQQKYKLLQDFYNYKYQKGLNMTAYISDLENLAYKLKALKQNMDDTMLITKILSTLPETFKYFISAWESTSKEERNLTNLTARLIAEESRLNTLENNGEQVAFKTSGTIPKNVNKVSQHSYANQKSCFKCGKYGHFARQCKQNEYKCNICKKTNHQTKDCYFKNKNKNESVKRVTFLTEQIDKEIDSTEWILDSGASSHMVNNKSKIRNWKENISEIGTAKENERMLSYGIGNIETKNCTLEEVIYVPNLSKNLLSVNKITQHGGKVIFENEKVQVYKDQNKIMEGKRNEKGLYVVELTDNKEEKALLSVAENAVNWHKKLGHLGVGNLKKLQHMSNGLNLKPEDFEYLENTVCEICAKARQTRNPFIEKRQRATRPLEIIHTDICGPVEPITWDGMKYFISFLDDYTHFTTVYLLTGKYEAVQAIKDFIKESETKWNLKTAKIRCDNGKEYVNNQLKEWCKNRGTVLDYTIPYSPQLNGKAERLNRTLMDKSRSLIFESGSNEEMWGEAIRVAAYLTNRSPTADLNKTPFEMWTNKIPNLSYIQIFGTDTYAKQLGYLKKLDERSQTYLFVGYAPHGYRLFDMKNRKIVISRDVLFQNKKVEFNLNDETNGENKDNEVKIEEQTNDENTTQAEDDNDMETEVGRGQRIKRTPAKLSDYHVYLTFEEILTRDDKDKWLNAVEEEKQSLKENNTWTLVDKDTVIDKKLLSNRWLFKIKDDGTYKARLVVRGCEQIFGEDYEETFSPVVGNSATRLLFAIAAQKNYEIIKFDIKTAFLYGQLTEEIYMHIPEAYEDTNNKVCKLNRALYGLKQAPVKWNERFSDFLKEVGLKPIQSERCIFKSEDSSIILTFYVDDGLIIGKDKKKIKTFLEELSHEFKLKVWENPNSFLGVSIMKNENNLILHQKAHINQLLENYNMLECRTTKIPLSKSDINTKMKDEKEYTNFPFRETVGSLLYVTQKTRPDLGYSVNFVSRCITKHTKSDINNIKHILKYLCGHKSFGIKYEVNSNASELTAYSDADYAGDTESRRSTTGYIIMYNGGPISWCTRRQPIVALSTTEAEYIAAADCCREVIYFKNLINELLGEDIKATLQVDNKSAIKLVKNGIINRKSKHIDVRYHFINEKVTEGILKIEYVNTQQQLADIFTKPLDYVKFRDLRDQLMCEIPM